VGRIRKALSITSVIGTGGAFGTPVKWESSAEKSAKEQARLMKEQNQLLAQIARNGQIDAATQLRASIPGDNEIKFCVNCLNRGCNQSVGNDVGWTRDDIQCDCLVHH
jgi:hypothetical protein